MMPLNPQSQTDLNIQENLPGSQALDLAAAKLEMSGRSALEMPKMA
jgi:hypothetical protein